MTDVERIPDMVQAQVRLHLVETEIKLENMKAANAGRPVTTAESRRLRAQRERLSAELDAWRYLVALAESDHYDEYVKVNQP